MGNWIVQGNPERYDVLGDLAAGRPIESWSITRHVDDIEPGDRVALWVSGKRAGVYAVGRVTDLPYEDVITASGWRRSEDLGRTMWFCPVWFDVVLDDPVLRPDLLADPRFKQARIITQPQAGNPFQTTDEEWVAIADRVSASRPTARSGDNVWDEVTHRARLWQEAGTPIYTLKARVRNVITGVTEGEVLRRSDRGKADHDSHTPVSKRQIVSLWDALTRDGDTVEHEQSVLFFAYALLLNSIPGLSFEDEPFRLVFTDRAAANRPFDPEDATRTRDVLVAAPPHPRGPGGGGEGEVHRALKERIKHDPMGTVGEPLSYEAEDLTERLGLEVRFVTGDRVDLLMRDEDGRYVVIEVEPTVGVLDHIGFHQAGKYRTLVAMAKGIPVHDVRSMVVAHAIDHGLSDYYSRQYAIESRVVDVRSTTTER